MEQKSTTVFDWRVYADATFAGLSVLIPIPLLDLAFEWLFRRRIAKAIAKQNGRSLDPAILKELNRTSLSCLALIFWPVTLALEFLKRLYRTVLYFLTVKQATDQLSYYWHRAYLLDYMFRQGHMDDPGTAYVAVAVLNRVLDQTTTSPLIQLAQQIVTLPTHIFRTLRRLVRRREEDQTVLETRIIMADSWQKYDSYWHELGGRFEAAYQAVEQERMIGFVAEAAETEGEQA